MRIRVKKSVLTFRNAKQKNERVTTLTAYDYSTAKLIDASGIDAVLVGDSLGMVMLGYEDTLSVTMEDMIHHTKAVARGVKDALVVSDLPFMSYQTSVYDAVSNAGRLIKEGRAQAVKLEGGLEVCPQIKAIVEASIPVMAHLGLTPQSVNAFGGFKVQGKDEEAARSLIKQAKGCGSGRSLCGGAGMHTGQAGRFDHKEHLDSDDRHRCGERLRRPSVGLSGHAGTLLRFHAEIRQALCRNRTADGERHRRLYI